MSAAGSFTAKASLEARRRPLLNVERSEIRISLFTNRPSAAEASRRAMATCVDAVLIFVTLHIDIEIVGHKRKSMKKRAFLIGQPHDIPGGRNPNQQTAEIHIRITTAQLWRHCGINSIACAHFDERNDILRLKTSYAVRLSCE